MITRNRRGTRKQLAEYLREQGIPISFQTLTMLCMPSNFQGPTPVFWFGRRPIYDFDDGLAWALKRATEVRRA
jgi:hypothetical protein